MKKTKLLSLILAALMLASSFLSCSNASQDESSDGSLSGSESSQSQHANDSATTYYKDMPSADFDGWVFNIAGGYGDLGDMNGVVEYMTMEEITGDEFNDDLYNRVIAVGDKYNASIVTHDVSGGSSLSNSITAGTRDYSAGILLIDGAGGYINNGLALPLNDLTIDLDMPFWDKGAQETFTINDKLFYCLSDITFSHYESCSVLFYNGALLTNNQITASPYDLYKEGKWTLDAMNNMMESVASDENGDGKYQENVDILGLIGRELRYVSPILASGHDIIYWDDTEQTFKSNMSNETLMAIGDWTRKFWFESEFNLLGAADATTTFKSDKALFNAQLIGAFRPLRDKEDDYGVILWPALTENTEIKVHVRNPSTLIVASDVIETEKVSTLMTALAAYAYDYIIEDYINRAVVGKGARDKNSADVIRSMLDSRIYETVYAFNLDAIGAAWQAAVQNGMYASMEKRVSAQLANSIEQTLSAYFD